MPKRNTSISGLLNLLVSKNIPFNFSYKKGGYIELEIFSNYFTNHSPVVYLSINTNCHYLIQNLMRIIEKESNNVN